MLFYCCVCGSCLEASWRVQSNHPKGCLLSSFPSLANLCPLMIHSHPSLGGQAKSTANHLLFFCLWQESATGGTIFPIALGMITALLYKPDNARWRLDNHGFSTYRLRPLYMWDHLSRASSQCGGLSFDTRVHSHGSSLCREELTTTTGTRQLHHIPTAHCRQPCLRLLQWKLSQLRGPQKMQQTSDDSNALWEYWSSNHKEHEKIHRFPIFMPCEFLFFLWNFRRW